MDNRAARRRAEKIAKKGPEFPDVPNVSGTKEACGNCAFAADPEIIAKVHEIRADFELRNSRPAPQPTPGDQVICMESPNHISQKVWAWCGRWKAKPK